MTRSPFAENAWRRMCGLSEKKKENMPSLGELKKTEWFPEFIKLMRNRMLMGAFRYGRMDRQDLRSYDLPAEAKKRINRYIETGNTENLVDAANMLGIEFKKGHHPNKHFESVDDGEHAKPTQVEVGA